LDDRPIYLFDEWASDQDPLFREIYKQLYQNSNIEATVLVISHDDRYFILLIGWLLDHGKLEPV